MAIREANRATGDAPGRTKNRLHGQTVSILDQKLLQVGQIEFW